MQHFPQVNTQIHKYCWLVMETSQLAKDYDKLTDVGEQHRWKLLPELTTIEQFHPWCDVRALSKPPIKVSYMQVTVEFAGLYRQFFGDDLWRLSKGTIWRSLTDLMRKKTCFFDGGYVLENENNAEFIECWRWIWGGVNTNILNAIGALEAVK